MFKENELTNPNTPIALQPWLWLSGAVFLLAVILAGQAARLLWKDTIEVNGQVRHFESGEPLQGAYVEVVWEELRKNLSNRQLYRRVVRTDDDGLYTAALPDEITDRINAAPVRGDSPLRVLGFTARVYKPGYRHLETSKLFHQRVAPVNLAWSSWSSGGFTIEMEEPSERDRAGDVRLMPATEPDHLRIRQLYGTFVALKAGGSFRYDVAERDWLSAMCREADRLALDAEVELQMREDICSPDAKGSTVMQLDRFEQHDRLVEASTEAELASVSETSRCVSCPVNAL